MLWLGLILNLIFVGMLVHRLIKGAPRREYLTHPDDMSYPAPPALTRQDALRNLSSAYQWVMTLDPDQRGNAWLGLARSKWPFADRETAYREAVKDEGFTAEERYILAEECYAAALKEPESTFTESNHLEEGRDGELERIAYWVIDLALAAGRLDEARAYIKRHTPASQPHNAPLLAARADWLARLEAEDR